MADLVLLTLDFAEFPALHRAAERGDEEALARIAGLWDAYKQTGVACFLCDVETSEPYSFTLPDHVDATKIIVVPLCETCRDLPRLVRQHRVTRLARKVFARQGKQLHYSYNRRR